MKIAYLSVTIFACMLTTAAGAQGAKPATGVDSAPYAGEIETTQAAYTSWKYENPGASHKFAENAKLAAAHASAMENAGATLPARAGQAAFTSWKFENPGAAPMVTSLSQLR